MADRTLAPPAIGLRAVGARPPLGHYLAEAWKRRRFGLALAGYRLTASLLLNRLGFLWLILKPLSMAIIYGAVFSFVLAGPARPDKFVQFLIIGVFVFEFFTGCLGSGSKAVTSNAKMVQSLGFPRILLPVSVILEQAMRMVPIVALLFGLLLVLGEPPTWSWMLLIPVLFAMALFNLGAALIVARLSVHARDVQQAVPILTRVLFYGSGVFFSVDGALSTHPVLLAVVQLVPTYDFISIARDVLLEGHAAPPLVWVAALGWAVLAPIVGVVFFWRAEARYGLSE